MSLLVAMFLAGLSVAGERDGASVDEGRRLYRSLCSGCHGAAGDGQSAVTGRMFPKPRDFTAGEYRFRTTASGFVPQRSDLARTIATGLPGTAMPAWGRLLSDDQIDGIVLYLEGLSPRFEEEPLLDEDVVVDPDGLSAPASTEASVARGAEIYAQMKCGKCHGERGRGDGEAAKTLENNDGSEARVFDFTHGEYKGGGDPVSVYRTFVTGLDGSPMPSYGDSLPEEADRWALVHYVMSLSRPRGLGFYLTNGPTWYEPAR